MLYNVTYARTAVRYTLFLKRILALSAIWKEYLSFLVKIFWGFGWTYRYILSRCCTHQPNRLKSVVKTSKNLTQEILAFPHFSNKSAQILSYQVNFIPTEKANTHRTRGHQTNKKKRHERGYPRTRPTYKFLKNSPPEASLKFPTKIF